MKLSMICLITLFATACVPAQINTGGCNTYIEHRKHMPDPDGVPTEFLRWFDVADAAMYERCREQGLMGRFQ